ncbi:TetR/AcrR family transcriptional regulator [Orrella dioscoreae]|nr:TetR/AcrR family transcriptional regulator [Orrella dioscoreae]
MARPRQFDADTVLDAAKHLFWDKGFEATSTEDLCQAMGLSRQSFYNAFGGKREVFLAALERYAAERTDAQIALLSDAPAPLQGLRELLQAVAAHAPDRRKLGCMSVATASAFGDEDADVSAILRHHGMRLQKAMQASLSRARDQGQLQGDTDLPLAAQFLRTSQHGISLAARTGATPAQLRGMAELALRAVGAA